MPSKFTADERSERVSEFYLATVTDNPFITLSRIHYPGCQRLVSRSHLSHITPLLCLLYYPGCQRLVSCSHLSHITRLLCFLHFLTKACRERTSVSWVVSLSADLCRRKKMYERDTGKLNAGLWTAE